jgi:hypothetical protein
LSLRQKALWRVPGLLLRIIGSLFSGELRRNNPVLLVLRSPTVLAMVLRRMWLRRMSGIAADETITACPCPLHGAQAGSSQLPKRRMRAS